MAPKPIRSEPDFHASSQACLLLWLLYLILWDDNSASGQALFPVSYREKVSIVVIVFTGIAEKIKHPFYGRQALFPAFCWIFLNGCYDLFAAVLF